MKYYKVCRKLLGNEIFENLISEVIKKIGKKFTEEISLELVVKILEINISTILIIAIAEVVEVDKQKVTIHESEEFLVEKDIENMEKEYKKYIEIIKQKIKNTLPLN